MKRRPAFFAAAALALFAAGCATTPPQRDKSLEPFTALSTDSRNVLAEEILEPAAVVAAVVDVDMRTDPRLTLLRYVPVRFRTGPTGELNLHALAPEETFRSVSALCGALRKRWAKGTLGIVVFFDGAPAGTRPLGDMESAALSEVLVSHLRPALDEAHIPFAWIVPAAARLFPAVP